VKNNIYSHAPVAPTCPLPEEQQHKYSKFSKKRQARYLEKGSGRLFIKKALGCFNSNQVP